MTGLFRSYPSHSAQVYALSCVLLAVSAAGCQRTPARALSPREEPAISVATTTVSEAPLQRARLAAGVLDVEHEADLAFKVPGVVHRVRVDDGARVRRGQLLASLDPTEVAASALQATEAVVKAERDLARARKLHDSDGIPRSMVDDAESQLIQARAQQSGADFNLRHAELHAPSDGIVDRRMVEVGEIVAAGRPVFHFKSRGTYVVRAFFSDRDALALHLGDVGSVQLDARPDERWPAHVTRIASSATRGAGTVEVELTLDQDIADLPSGLTAKVSLANEEVWRSVPLTALVDGDGEQAALFVLHGERVERVPVKIAFIAGERVALKAGVDAGTVVVGRGASELRDGARVRVVGEE